MEGIAGADVQLRETFQRPDTARHAGRKLAEECPDYLMLPGIYQRQPRLLQDSHGFFAISGLQQRFDDLLQRAEIFRVSFKYAMCKRRGLVPIGILEIKIEEQFGLLATFLEIGHLFQELRSLGEIAL